MKPLSPIQHSLMTMRTFKDPNKALARIQDIYDTNIRYLRHAFDDFAKGVVG